MRCNAWPSLHVGILSMNDLFITDSRFCYLSIRHHSLSSSFGPIIYLSVLSKLAHSISSIGASSAVDVRSVGRRTPACMHGGITGWSTSVTYNTVRVVCNTRILPWLRWTCSWLVFWCHLMSREREREFSNKSIGSTFDYSASCPGHL